MKFTENQLKAIKHKNGPALVLAVPGSGKTTVLLERINQLILNNINPKNILAMTFSKNQALDMENRFFEKYSKKIQFSTIHSFAYAIVRMYYSKIGKTHNLLESSKYNKFQILAEIFFSIKKRKISEEETEKFFRISGFIKNTLMDYPQYVKMYGKTFSKFEKVYLEFENFKTKNNIIDFDDILIICLSILKKDKEILQYVKNRFKYIQIDEGQDTSLVQLEIIYLISNPANNLFIVADDDQSIYGFRGASSKHLLNLNLVYPNLKIYYMEDNFRCSQDIVNLSNILIKNNKQRYKKNIVAQNHLKEEIKIIKTKNTQKQITKIYEIIKEKTKNGDSIAILYRNNLSAIPLLDILKNEEFYIKDVRNDFYNNQIIKDIISINLFAKDPYDIELFKKIYYKLNSYIKKDFVNEVSMMPKNISIIERLYECKGVNDFFTEKFDNLNYFLSKISSMDFEKSIYYILNILGYQEYIEELSRKTNSNKMASNRIIDTIKILASNIKSIKEFEDKIQNLSKIKNTKNKNAKIFLSSIHGAKGLEFDHVIIIDLINEEFPSSISLNSEDEFGILEEERRLFYVGMTRAKKSLSLIIPKKINDKDTKTSLFISEITKNKIK